MSIYNYFIIQYILTYNNITLTSAYYANSVADVYTRNGAERRFKDAPLYNSIWT